MTSQEDGAAVGGERALPGPPLSNAGGGDDDAAAAAAFDANEKNNNKRPAAAAADGEAAAAAAAGGEEASEPPRRRARKSRWEEAAPEPALPPPPPMPPLTFSPLPPGAVPPPPPPPQRTGQVSMPQVSAAATSALTLAAASGARELTLPGGIKVQLPSAVVGGPAQKSDDPAVLALHDQLSDTERRLRESDWQIPPSPQRSPSPEPVYDRKGIRLNTREVRAREKLSEKRQDLIEELIKADRSYRPPHDYRPQKKRKKLYIPQKKYPNFNFIGLVIGPRGKTQRELQAQTGCRVVIRGRGAMKEGAARAPGHDYGEDDDLHVLIEGDTREAVELAAQKVAPMLDPENDWFHDTKDKQLRELAIINGTLKEGDGDACFLCGSGGHRQFECPSRGVSGSGAGGDAFRLPTAIQASVEAQYARDVARMQGGGGGNDGGKKTDDEYKSFLEELGGGGGSGDGGGGNEGLPPRPNFGVPPSSRLNSSRRNMLREPFSQNGSSGGGGGGGESSSHSSAPNECKLFLGNLAPSVDDEVLRDALETALGLPHGPIGAETLLEVKVVPDDGRNLGDLPVGAPMPKNRGFAFAVMSSGEAAADACRRANGFLVEGKPLKVQPRGGGPPPPGVPPGGFPLPGVFDGPGGGGGLGGGVGRKDSEDEEGRKLFITGLDVTATDAALESLCALNASPGIGGGSGAEKLVQSVRVVADRETGRPKGFAFVVFFGREAAQRALREMDGLRAPGLSQEGRGLIVRMAGDRSGPGGGGGGGFGGGGGGFGGVGGGGFDRFGGGGGFHGGPPPHFQQQGMMMPPPPPPPPYGYGGGGPPAAYGGGSGAPPPWGFNNQGGPPPPPPYFQQQQQGGGNFPPPPSYAYGGGMQQQPQQQQWNAMPPPGYYQQQQQQQPPPPPDEAPPPPPPDDDDDDDDAPPPPPPDSPPPPPLSQEGGANAAAAVPLVPRGNNAGGSQQQGGGAGGARAGGANSGGRSGEGGGSGSQNPVVSEYERFLSELKN